MSHKPHGLATRALHVGQGPDPATGAVVVPIHLATTFAQESPGRHKGFEYSRSGNPTRDNLEACLASLEGAEHGLAFSSGLAATATVMLLLDPGDHVVFTEDVYGGTFRLFDKVFQRYGLTFTAVDPTDPDAIVAAMTDRTRLVWLESPTNPLLRVVDLDAVSELVHGAGALVAVDSTFASPVLQRPLELGADLVIHSSTKFLGGHSDVLGGAVLTSNDILAERVRFHQNAVGAVPSPFDCWLLLRGLKTLQVRVVRQCENALAIARWLEGQDEVTQVYYPGL
ncbi:MAG TPA: aminotransferase class I/II-fold pyridoxal phosphate-dependent enzyme, partial [Acidimicrobiales bacterium]|nr:aminotransferase class I/II-fold pyridoxal phosphate-dependent enzyme [Acidimicrobiales bacterium]